MDTVAVKKALRKEKLATRKALSAEEVKQKSKAIFDLWLKEFSLDSISNLHLFQTITGNNEIDTALFMEAAWNHDPLVKVVIPVVNPTAGVLEHVELKDEIVLEKNKWGIPEPVKPYGQVNPKVVDMVLVPMLAFDLTGNRLGYGKGYYDKFLCLTRPDCVFVGLCLEDGKVEEGLPTDEFDIPMHFVVTEQSVYTFSGNSKGS